jgi:hypothetical protein
MAKHLIASNATIKGILARSVACCATSTLTKAALRRSAP